jgi:uncharacterized membrane protein YkoI
MILPTNGRPAVSLYSVRLYRYATKKVPPMRLIPTLFAMSLGFAVPAAAAPVTIDDVRDMAFAKGIVKIEEIALDHHGVWKVEGEDAGGHEIKMKVDAASGAIIKLKRDD